MGEQPHRWMMTAPGGPMERHAFDPFQPGDDEVVVEVAGCGVCHTDLGFYYNGVRTKRSLPLALGHEISGRVVATGSAAAQWAGAAVLGNAVISCGRCGPCLRGRPNICSAQTLLGNNIDGGFATHVTVPARGLCRIDEARLSDAGLKLHELSVVADAVTTPFQAVTRSGLGPGDLACVVGVGGIGGYCVQIAAALGAKVIAIDVDEAKLEAIAGHGASLTLNASGLDAKALKQQVLEFARQSGIPDTEWFIFECSGTAAGQLSAFGLLTYGATLSVVGFTMARVELRLSNLMAFDARVLGNWGCSPSLYPAALDLVYDGKVKLQPFIEVHPLNDINRVFSAVHAREIGRRVILVPDA